MEDKHQENYPPFEPLVTDSTSREEFYRISDASGEVSLTHVSSVNSIVKSFVTGSMERGMSAAAQASAAWWSANGDLEHRHTKGVYLKEYASRPPVLYVYIDTSSLLQDFTTNKDNYLARLANRGFAVSDIKFQLSRKKGWTTTSLQSQKKQSPAPLSPLNKETAAQVVAAADDLPEGLRKAAVQAVSSMLARQHVQKETKEELRP